MQESQITIIVSYSSSIIGLSCLSVNPALRNELFCVWTPDFCGSVDGPWCEVDTCSFGNLLRPDGGGSDGDAEGNGDSGVEAEDFVGESVKEWEGFEDAAEIYVWIELCGW